MVEGGGRGVDAPWEMSNRRGATQREGGGKLRKLGRPPPMTRTIDSPDRPTAGSLDDLARKVRRTSQRAAVGSDSAVAKSRERRAWEAIGGGLVAVPAHRQRPCAALRPLRVQRRRPHDPKLDPTSAPLSRSIRCFVMQHLPLFAHRTCSSAAGVGGRLGSRPLLAAVALPPTSRRCAASSASRSPPRVTSSKNGRPKAMPAGKLLVKSKGELNLSFDYEDLGQPSRSPRANPASPAAGSFKAGAPKPKAKRSPHGKTVKERPRGLPVDARLPAGTALELRDFVANKKAEERQRRLKMLERDPLTVKRNRWAWEWFGEGKELVEIGERVAYVSIVVAPDSLDDVVLTRRANVE
jgi:hypothetical protein